MLLKSACFYCIISHLATFKTNPQQTIQRSGIYDCFIGGTLVPHFHSKSTEVTDFSLFRSVEKLKMKAVTVFRWENYESLWTGFFFFFYLETTIDIDLMFNTEISLLLWLSCFISATLVGWPHSCVLLYRLASQQSHINPGYVCKVLDSVLDSTTGVPKS